LKNPSQSLIAWAPIGIVLGICRGFGIGIGDAQMLVEVRYFSPDKKYPST